MNKKMRVTAFNSDGTTTQFNYWDMSLIHKALTEWTTANSEDLGLFGEDKDLEEYERASNLLMAIKKLGGLND